jgi:hypothetical protein
MFGDWILRGSKAERVAGAAVIDGLLGAVTAWANGKDPLIHGVAQALAGGQAMANHRLVQRATAHERNSKVADTVASVLEAARAKVETTSAPATKVHSPVRLPR